MRRGLVCLALLLFACAEATPPRPEPEWRRLDGSPGGADALERDHADCTAAHGRPDERDGNAMARWSQAFGDCMRERGWRLARPDS